jgi:hypothetical protein
LDKAAVYGIDFIVCQAAQGAKACEATMALATIFAKDFFVIELWSLFKQS